MYLALAMLWPV